MLVEKVGQLEVSGLHLHMAVSVLGYKHFWLALGGPLLFILGHKRALENRPCLAGSQLPTLKVHHQLCCVDGWVQSGSRMNMHTHRVALSAV